MKCQGTVAATLSFALALSPPLPSADRLSFVGPVAAGTPSELRRTHRLGPRRTTNEEDPDGGGADHAEDGVSPAVHASDSGGHSVGGGGGGRGGARDNNSGGDGDDGSTGVPRTKRKVVDDSVGGGGGSADDLLTDSGGSSVGEDSPNDNDPLPPFEFSFRYFEDLRRNSDSALPGGGLGGWQVVRVPVPDGEDEEYYDVVHLSAFLGLTRGRQSQRRRGGRGEEEEEEYDADPRIFNGSTFAAILAVHHWNNGIANVVPDIAVVQSEMCPNLKFTAEFFDTQFSPAVAARSFLTTVLGRIEGGDDAFSGKDDSGGSAISDGGGGGSNTVEANATHTGPNSTDTYATLGSLLPSDPPVPLALVGSSSSAVSAALAALSSSYRLPQFSHSATSSSFDANRDGYDLFGRLLPSNANGDARAAAEYFALRLQATHVGVIFVRDTYGSEYASAFRRRASELGMRVALTSFSGVGPRADPTELKVAMDEMARTEYRYFMGMFFSRHYEDVLSEARARSIVGRNYLWMFSDAVLEDLGTVTIPRGTAAAEVTNGVGIFHVAPPRDVLVSRDGEAEAAAKWGPDSAERFDGKVAPRGPQEYVRLRRATYRTQEARDYLRSKVREHMAPPAADERPEPPIADDAEDVIVADCTSSGEAGPLSFTGKLSDGSTAVPLFHDPISCGRPIRDEGGSSVFVDDVIKYTSVSLSLASAAEVEVRLRCEGPSEEATMSIYVYEHSAEGIDPTCVSRGKATCGMSFVLEPTALSSADYTLVLSGSASDAADEYEIVLYCLDHAVPLARRKMENALETARISQGEVGVSMLKGKNSIREEGDDLKGRFRRGTDVPTDGRSSAAVSTVPRALQQDDENLVVDCSSSDEEVLSFVGTLSDGSVVVPSIHDPGSCGGGDGDSGGSIFGNEEAVVKYASVRLSLLFVAEVEVLLNCADPSDEAASVSIYVYEHGAAEGDDNATCVYGGEATCDESFVFAPEESSVTFDYTFVLSGGEDEAREELELVFYCLQLLMFEDEGGSYATTTEVPSVAKDEGGSYISTTEFPVGNDEGGSIVSDFPTGTELPPPGVPIEQDEDDGGSYVSDLPFPQDLADDEGEPDGTSDSGANHPADDSRTAFAPEDSDDTGTPPHDEGGSNAEAKLPSPFEFLMYDTIISVALAACRASHEDRLLDPEYLYEAFSHNSFDGASGRVEFDSVTGSREYRTVSYAVSNLVALPPGAEAADDDSDDVRFDVRITDIYAPESGGGEEGTSSAAGGWRSLQEYVFNDGSADAPGNLPPPDVTIITLELWAKVFGLVLCGCLVALTIAFAIWSKVHEKTSVIAAAQPFFLYLLCIGCALLSLTILPMSFTYEDGVSKGGLDVACMLSIWMFEVGFVTSFSTLFSKLYRVNKLFEDAARFTRVTVNIPDVMKPMVLLLTLAVSILTAWTIVAPLQFRSIETLSLDQFERNVEIITVCYPTDETLDAAMAFFIAMMVVDGVVLLFACYQAYKARNISVQYSESRYIGIAMAIMAEGILIGVPIMITVPYSPTAQFMVRSLLVCVICCAAMLPIFIPKVIFVKKFYKEKEEKRRLREERIQRQREFLERVQGTAQKTEPSAALPSTANSIGVTVTTEPSTIPPSTMRSSLGPTVKDSSTHNSSNNN
mmetsp:Transcript_14205/g.26883  ORF Transcript_14205/g.26883 Transcript_14205/m.26883 type:complete len:1644 (-) Transcript_14205:63-4994(-)